MSKFLDRFRYFKQKGETFADGHGQLLNTNRDWEDGYRQRWQHDKIVRSTHGVNCTGSCSWKIYVKNGLVTWETQQTDYPRTRPDLPNHEPRGCPRGASYSWYLYSANRLKYPMMRKRLMKMWREAKALHRGNSDHTKLIAMLNQLNDYSVPMSSILGKYFDTENLAYWMAFQLLTGNTDTQSRNMYLYSPTNSDTFYVLDWDNDGMLMRKENQIRNISTGSSWEQGVSNYWGNVLFKRCLQTKSFRDELDKAVKREYRYMSAKRINTMVDHYESITRQYLWRTPDSMYEPLTRAQYDEVAGQLHDEVAQNYRIYKESFDKPMPFFIDAPQAADGKLKFSWDTSYDFRGEDLSYDVTVAKDYLCEDVIFSKTDLALPETVTDLPGDGQYFIRVRARNASGKTQDAFDYYMTDTGKTYGTRCFYIKSGKIVEDVNAR